MKLNFWKWFTDAFKKAVEYVVSKLTSMDGKEGLSWEDIEKTAEWIKQAELSDAFGSGEERREWVLEQIRTFRKKALPHVVELLFWTALNYAKEKGDIWLGGGKDK